MVNSRVANLIATWEDLEMRVPYGRGGSFESVAYQKYSTAYQVAASYPWAKSKIDIDYIHLTTQLLGTQKDSKALHST